MSRTMSWGGLRAWIWSIQALCAELGVTIVKGVLSRDHVHMFVAIPLQLAVSELMRRVKGRSSRKIQQEFPAIRKRYWVCHFWAQGYFSTTRQHHRRRDTSVSRAAHRQTYQRQPVVV
jgi:putative transposase